MGSHVPCSLGVPWWGPPSLQDKGETGEADGDEPRCGEQGLSWLRLFLLAGLCWGARAVCVGWSWGEGLRMHFPGDTINDAQAHQNWKVPFFLLARGFAACAAITCLACPHAAGSATEGKWAHFPKLFLKKWGIMGC